MDLVWRRRLDLEAVLSCEPEKERPELVLPSRLGADNVRFEYALLPVLSIVGPRLSRSVEAVILRSLVLTQENDTRI